MTRRSKTLPLSNDDFSDDESIYAESEVSEDHKLIENQADPGLPLSEPTTDPTEQQIEAYDKIMTGWDPLPQLAGQKRTRSPEPQIMQTKRGRQVIRHDYNKLNKGYTAQLSVDPSSWNDAMSSVDAPLWKTAANTEFKSLQKKGAIKIIKRSELPKGRKTMKSKWVFKKKFNADGSIEKYKARCTVKGFTQRKGIDFNETFAPTPRPETGRILLIMAHQLGWYRKQGDVPTAFLNPDLNTDLYMEMPRGFEREGHIIQLQKGLYGLKQAGALWYDDARETLSKQGLQPTTSDICLYTNAQKDLFVLMYVDDFQIVGPNLDKINNLLKILHNKYNLKTVNTDLFLGIRITNPAEDTLALSQGRYAKELL